MKRVCVCDTCGCNYCPHRLTYVSLKAFGSGIGGLSETESYAFLDKSTKLAAVFK